MDELKYEYLFSFLEKFDCDFDFEFRYFSDPESDLIIPVITLTGSGFKLEEWHD